MSVDRHGRKLELVTGLAEGYNRESVIVALFFFPRPFTVEGFKR